MTSPINWITVKKASELSGISRKLIEEFIDLGELKFSKKNKNIKNSSLMINVESFNKVWERRIISQGKK